MIRELWVEAWEIYASIRRDHQRSHQFKKLLDKQLKLVLSLYKKQAGWYGYDKDVRKALAKGDPSAKLGEIHDEYWLMALSTLVQKPGGNPSFRRETPFGKGGFKKNFQNSFVPKGFCVQYHKFQKCFRQNCFYNHACYNCNKGQHPAVACPEKSFRGSKQIAMPHSGLPTQKSK